MMDIRTYRRDNGDGRRGVLVHDMTRRREIERTSYYAGYGWVGSQLFYDPQIAPNEVIFTIGTQIGNLTVVKNYIRVDLSTLSVSYSATGWFSMPIEPMVVWRRVADIYGAFHVDRTG